ncbi:MAG: BREX-3 system P-loop-containing protein BrxF [Burkholderiaceae bacterium]|nr:BREX-3 system P-loop-containing protein BrxF [Burkholderiaceae bacterium]
MLDDLLRLVNDAGALQSRLVLILGGDDRRRGDLLARAAAHFGTQSLPLGIDFARRISAVARRQRPLQASSLLRDSVDAAFPGVSPALLDRTEILFDRTLQFHALVELKRLAHSRTVVAAWPGQLRDQRLIYAPANHPEHCDHPAAGFLVHHIS